MNLKQDNFIQKAIKKHNNKYDYSKVNYINSSTKVCITCKKHGDFLMTPSNHLNGQGCPKCSGRGLTKEEVIERFKEVHGDSYDYSNFVFTKMHNKSIIICHLHGEFQQTPSKHLIGHGCPICGISTRAKHKTLTTEEFKAKSSIVHDNKYDYSKTIYKGTYKRIVITCPKHGDFLQRANDHLNGHGCPICGNNISIGEKEIEDYIKSLNTEVITNVRGILCDKKEIDIFIPQHNIAIEYNGLKWHSNEFKKDDYHLVKTEECKSKGIKLMHIFEDEWINKKEIIKSIICNSIFKTQNKIYARDCLIKEIDNGIKENFLNENNLYGSNDNLIINLGLFYGNELVSIMVFKENKIKEFEIHRFNNKLFTNVIGGASKLFKYFIKKYKPKSVKTFVDYRIFSGSVYEKLGFRLIKQIKPNFYYIVGSNRENRTRVTNPSINSYKIFDCGTLEYIWFK